MKSRPVQSDVCRGAIWWVLPRWKPTWSDVGNTLAPSVSGSLRAKPGCGCPAWQSCHWSLSCV